MWNGSWKSLLSLTLLVLLTPFWAGGQVAQHSGYQGRLTDANGVPKTGTVTMVFSFWDGEDQEANLTYSEEHPNVALSVDGVFSVELGNGTSTLGSYDATLFTGTPLYLEVVVDGEALTPRQTIGSVPSALVAGGLAPPTSRFEVTPDGLTVKDHKTGLLWERKTGTFDPSLPESGVCSIEVGGCPDPHDVNNRYSWSETGTLPDGSVFKDFLARLNGDPTVVSATAEEATGFYTDEATGQTFSLDPTACFAGRCDWRLPAISELATILIGPDAAPGQATTCEDAPCLDPAFAGETFIAAGWDTVTLWSISSSPQTAAGGGVPWGVRTGTGITEQIALVDDIYAGVIAVTHLVFVEARGTHYQN